MTTDRDRRSSLNNRITTQYHQIITCANKRPPRYRRNTRQFSQLHQGYISSISLLRDKRVTSRDCPHGSYDQCYSLTSRLTSLAAQSQGPTTQLNQVSFVFGIHNQAAGSSLRKPAQNVGHWGFTTTEIIKFLLVTYISAYCPIDHNCVTATSEARANQSRD